jgi:ferredoxin-NADP reductase/MOSC domain-containing protein YiiM
VTDTLVSVNVAMPRDVSWRGRTVRTGIWKSPVAGEVMARRLNLDGDGQGDLEGHGGEQRAVFVYQLNSYRYWQDHLGRDDFTPGMFGENFTVDGLADAEVCVGDRYRIGTAEFEVTQPRTTCYRVGIRLGVPEMPALLVSHHRPGFYFRVLSEGHVRAGDEIVRTHQDPRRLSVADIDALLYLPDPDLAAVRAAVTIPALSPGWRQSFAELVSDERPAHDETVSGWAGFAPLRVTRIVPETDSVTSVYLAAPDGRPLPCPRAGQYLTMRLPVGERPIVRTYSLSSEPGADSYRLSIKREDQGVGSTYLTSALALGQTVDVASPRGEFVLVDEDTPVVLLSAGIGITPVLAMLHELARQRSRREIWWITAARTPAQHPLTREAHELLTRLPHGHEYAFYSAAAAGDLAPPAVAERLSRDSLARLALPTDATAYLCGPDRFMADMQVALLDLGVAPAKIRTEIFGARTAINPGVVAGAVVAPHAPPTPGDGPLVTFGRSGLTVPFDTKQRSLLEMAELCDVPTRFACRSGVCQTCSTPLLTGRVEYAPDPLEPPAPGEALLCCCRPATDVVLDM